MYAPDTMAMLGFNLKLIAGRSKKNILVSTGTTEVKKRLLPAIVKLADTNINLFATDGTHREYERRHHAWALTSHGADRAAQRLISRIKRQNQRDEHPREYTIE